MEAFNERVARAARSQLEKELGVRDLSAVKDNLATLQQMKEAEEERKKQQMSELERAQTEANEAKQRATELEEARDAAQLKAHVTQLCAERGIRDVGYAEYKIMGKLAETPESEDLDEEKYLDELLQDERQRVALGVQNPAEPPPPPKAVDDPANTSPAAGGQHQQPKPPNAAPEGEKDAFAMTDEEWQAKRKALGIML
jgi:hypothetical protein